MSDRKTHQLVGTISGATRAGYISWNQPGFVMETVGGGFGGYLASMLPDQLEPATSSWHRGACHSLGAAGAVASMDKVLLELAATCRAEANKYRAIQTVQDPFTGEFRPVPIGFFQVLAEWFWSFLAGVLNGLSVGYLSHLALDACTPRSIPLLGA